MEMKNAEYQIGEKVVHCPEGVCLIEDILMLDVDKKTRREFYKLRSMVDNNVIIYVATDGKKQRFRGLKSKTEILKLLENQEIAINLSKMNSQRRMSFRKQALFNDDMDTVFQLIKMYISQSLQGHLSISDGNWLKKAEQYVFSEVAAVLSDEYEAVVNRAHNYMELAS